MFTHKVPTRGVNAHSCVKKRMVKIPWRVTKGAETSCGIFKEY
jgi:hypothetical protein